MHCVISTAGNICGDGECDFSMRGRGGDGDRVCGDGVGMGIKSVGMGTTYILRGGDGDKKLSPCHSLLHTRTFMMALL